jgi:hypothetical protein
MNIKVLNKLESGYAKLDWKSQRHKLNINDLETIVDIIDNFKSKPNVKELVICKFKTIPAYIYVPKSEYTQILNWICQRFIDAEIYEKCSRVKDLIYLIKITEIIDED